MTISSLTKPLASVVSLVKIGVLFLFGMNALGAESPFDDLKKLIRRRFPEVPQLSTQDLQAWLNDPSRPEPLLLDVRTEREFSVSHLPGASRVDPSSNASEVIPFLPAGRSIVTYCSVGYRSSGMAQKLLKAGVKSVQNLEGSIFQWANDGRPLENNGKPADKVDPFDAKWGKLLNENKRSFPISTK